MSKQIEELERLVTLHAEFTARVKAYVAPVHGENLYADSSVQRKAVEAIASVIERRANELAKGE